MIGKMICAAVLVGLIAPREPLIAGAASGDVAALARLHAELIASAARVRADIRANGRSWL